jgi:hypothetical protein
MYVYEAIIFQVLYGSEMLSFIRKEMLSKCLNIRKKKSFGISGYFTVKKICDYIRHSSITMVKRSKALTVFDH